MDENKRLKKLMMAYENVNEWLKYSETKNAVLVTILGTFMVSKFTTSNIKILFGDIKLTIFQELICYYTIEAMLLLFIAFIILLVSFYPQSKKHIPWFQTREKKENDNWLYYGDISKYSEREYLDLIAQSDNINYSHEEHTYANQIVVNSLIAYRKNQYTKTAIVFILSAVLTPLGYVIIYLLTNPNNQ